MSRCSTFSYLVIACIIGALFYSTVIHHADNTPLHVVNAMTGIFTNLTALADQFPRDYLILTEGLSGLQLRLRDAQSQFNHTTLPDGCKKDTRLLLNTTIKTIEMIEDTLINLNSEFPFAVYKFQQLNTWMQDDPATMYGPALENLAGVLGVLVSQTGWLSTRFTLLNKLLAGSRNICSDISSNNGQLWEKLLYYFYDGNVDDKLLQKDIELFKSFIKEQDQWRVIFQDVPNVVAKYLVAIQQLHWRTKHSLVNIPNFDSQEHVIAVDELGLMFDSLVVGRPVQQE